MLLTHGWPGSVLEFRHVIDPLVNPEKHGGEIEDAFHLVIPALPGYAWSGKPTETGCDYHRTARAWAVLMQRLGYSDIETAWAAQGRDWGAEVAAALGQQAPKGLRGVHMNTIFLDVKKELQTPTKRNHEGVERAKKLDKLWEKRSGYFLEQATKPQTVGYGLADSPLAQAAWIYEKFREWCDLERSPSKSVEDVFRGKDETLDTIML